MALIKCPECGKEISDKAPACIHCGYPLNNQSLRDKKIPSITIEIFGQTYDVSDIYNRSEYQLNTLMKDDNKFKGIAFLRREYNLGLTEAKKIYEEIYDKIYLPNSGSKQITTQASPPSTLPKCPTCGSINIEKVSSSERGLSFLWAGLASKKLGKQFKCKDCGYYW